MLRPTRSVLRFSIFLCGCKQPNFSTFRMQRYIKNHIIQIILKKFVSLKNYFIICETFYKKSSKY